MGWKSVGLACVIAKLRLVTSVGTLLLRILLVNPLLVRGGFDCGETASDGIRLFLLEAKKAGYEASSLFTGEQD